MRRLQLLRDFYTDLNSSTLESIDSVAYTVIKVSQKSYTINANKMNKEQTSQVPIDINALECKLRIKGFEMNS